MFCRKCYSPLDPAAQNHRCPKCDRSFDPANPGTTLARPFPDRWGIVRYILATSVISIVFAWIIACFQMVGASGH